MQERVLTHQDVLRILPERNVWSHKGDFGRVMLLCGSRGYTGAAALCAMGCLRSGAGLAYLCVPECIYTIEAVKLNEAVVIPFPDQDGAFSSSGTDLLRSYFDKMDVVVVGPGMGQTQGTMAVLQAVMEQFTGPVVVDADGINLLSRHMYLLRERTAPTIITPHIGEYRRIHPSADITQPDDAISFAKEFGCILVLKGHETLVTDGELCYRNKTGNPGMAVGGSGDLLAGMIGGLAAQGIPLLQAVAASVWLHGAAGDLAAERLGQYAMLPTDSLEDLPRLMK